MKGMGRNLAVLLFSLAGAMSLAAAGQTPAQQAETPVARAGVPVVTANVTTNWMEFTLRYVVDYRLRRVTKDRLFQRIIEEIDKTAGRVSIASSSLEISKMAPLEVRLHAQQT